MSATVSITRNSQEWDGWCKQAGLDDVYFTLRYGKVWEEQEAGTVVGIRLQSELGDVLYPLLQVSLDRLDEGRGLCDLRVPYDFGGPWFSTHGGPLAARLALADEFDAVMAQLAREWNVVTEFGRMHPHAPVLYNGRQPAYAEHYWVDLSRGLEGVRGDSHPNHRKNVRGARKRGAAVCFTSPADVEAEARRASEDFIALYARSMDRLGATKSFRFSEQTLRAVLALPEIHIATARLGDAIAGMAVFLHAGQVLFYFLAASEPAHQYCRPANLILEEGISLAFHLGCTGLHLGGGHSGLAAFKSQIGRHRIPYYLRKQIWAPAAYEKILVANGCTAEAVFPGYGKLIG